jgi:glycogen debranching enzyme
MTLLLGDPGAGTPHEGLLEGAERSWLSWFAAASRPQGGDHAAYLHAWWALAVNQLRLDADSDLTAVVPSKVGYLGLWQWDAYFAAIGLRHGQGGLAQAQLELALRHQLPDGQLPDVVHDAGILHSVDELPTADRVRLAEHVGSRHGSDTGSALRAAVPVTKPPLAAWAVAKLAHCHELGDFADFALPRLRQAHEWWFRVSDPDGRGLPRYLHPYSSGIDDCPVWDFGTDISTPDLGSYLALDADALAELATSAARPAEADWWRGRADQVSARLVAELWDPARGRFGSRQAGTRLPSRTALDVLPLLTGRLTETQVGSIAAALHDPSTFGGRHRVPTAGVADAAFDPEGMWRGPVWINTNYLVVQGLRRMGLHDEADGLAAETLALVEGSPSIAEYWNPLTGLPAERATAPFTWSAALYIDLAVTGGSLA